MLWEGGRDRKEGIRSDHTDLPSVADHIHPGGSETARAFWHVSKTDVQNSLQIP